MVLSTPLDEAAQPFGSREGSITFPALSILELADVAFDEVLFETFAAGLRFRSAHGAPLRRLVLKRCRKLSEDNLRVLRELVVDVEIAVRHVRI